MKTIYTEYVVLIWEDAGLSEHLVTEDYNKVVSTCEHLSTVGIEYEVRRVTYDLLDL